ncbi:hypothetical protein ACI8AG_01120 [Blastococcus sp. SYSU DS0552]
MSASQNGGEWFPSESTTPFLEQARRVAPSQLDQLVRPVDTWGMAEPIGPLLAVDVPDVPDGEVPVINNHVYVRWGGQLLGGYWGCSHVWDDFDERDEEALVVSGATMTDAEAATRAVTWLAQQLSRPLDLEVWRAGRFVLGRRWVLADTRTALGARGCRWGSPSSVTRLRPDQR